MSVHAFDNKSIRSFLLSKFLPLLLFSIVIVIACSIVSAWIGASRGGQLRASSFARNFSSEIDEIRGEAALARVAVEHAIEHDQVPRIPTDYMMLKLLPGGSYETISGEMNEKVSPQALADDLLHFSKEGIQELQGSLVFSSPFKIRGKNGKLGNYLLLKYLRDRFADRLSVSMGTEVSIYMLRPTKRIYATSWMNRKHERIVPDVPPGLWEDLASLKDGDILKGSAVYHVPDYSGIYSELDGIENFDQGENEIRSFHAFTPLLDVNKNRIGYFSVIVPEDVLLFGVKQAIWILILIGLGVALASTWLIIRTANQFAEPLTEYTEEINQIARNLNLKSSKYGGEIHSQPTAQGPNELASLATSIEILKQEMIRSDGIGKMIEEERTRSQFASKMAALGEMSASVAHEINNPVAVIHAISDELQEKARKGQSNPEEVRRLAQVIKETATRVGNIIRALLRLSRDANDDMMEMRSVSGLIEDATILVRDQMLKEQILFQVKGLDKDIRIFCRGTQLSQVILNLLSNAIDAVESCNEKWITLTVSRLETSLQISVTDSGRGVPENLRLKIMEPFVTTKPPGKGTGLGLSISRHILEEHHGKLFLDETSSQTRFVMEVPIGSDPLPSNS